MRLYSKRRTKSTLHRNMYLVHCAVDSTASIAGGLISFDIDAFAHLHRLATNSTNICIVHVAGQHPGRAAPEEGLHLAVTRHGKTVHSGDWRRHHRPRRLHREFQYRRLRLHETVSPPITFRQTKSETPRGVSI